MTVVDASAILEVLLATPRGLLLADRFRDEGARLFAPHLLDLEVAQVLRRLVARGEIAESRAVEALADLALLPIERYPHDALLPRIWELRSNLTAYAAAYVALAEVFGANVVTRDARLARAPGLRVAVSVV